MVERLESVQQVFDQMPTRLLPEQADGLDVVIQMCLTGNGGGKWYIIIKDSLLTVNLGSHDTPNMTMTMASSDWLDTANGDSNSTGLFMSGKIRITGDMQLAMKMQTMLRFSSD